MLTTMSVNLLIDFRLNKLKILCYCAVKIKVEVQRSFAIVAGLKKTVAIQNQQKTKAFFFFFNASV